MFFQVMEGLILVLALILNPRARRSRELASPWANIDSVEAGLGPDSSAATTSSEDSRDFSSRTSTLASGASEYVLAEKPHPDEATDQKKKPRVFSHSVLTLVIHRVHRVLSPSLSRAKSTRPSFSDEPRMRNEEGRNVM